MYEAARAGARTHSIECPATIGVSERRKLTPEALPEGLEVIEPGGHFFDMIGLRTADALP